MPSVPLHQKSAFLFIWKTAETRIIKSHKNVDLEIGLEINYWCVYYMWSWACFEMISFPLWALRCWFGAIEFVVRKQFSDERREL